MDYDARKETLFSQEESIKIEIYFSIRQLSHVMAYLQIYTQETNHPPLKLITTKPKAAYNAHYDFPESLILDYVFEGTFSLIQQMIIVQVYAHSEHGQLIGKSEASVGEIVRSKSDGICKDIHSGAQSIGTLNFRGEKVEQGTTRYVEFTLFGRNIDVGSSCLFFGEGEGHWALYKIKNHQQYLLYQSEVRKGKDNRFNTFKINQKRLCNNNPQQPIVFRFLSGAGTSLIGEAKTDLESLLKGKQKYTLMKNNHEKGVIMLNDFKQFVKYEFPDFLQSGMQMAMVVCIDFTASNGLQNQPKSLHYTTNTKKSQYEQALQQVSAIVLDYDADKLVPTFGFGAKVHLPNFNTGGKVHHCFPINGQQSNPNLFQLPGIMQGYRNALPYLTFSGPTYFAPLLREAMNVCQNMKREVKEYMILVILTDGLIDDKEEVKDLLVKCGKLPLSIIIIGIGKGEDGWSAMEELNDDDCVMTDFQGNRTQRDLVGFVDFERYQNDPVELARNVLQELPRQVEEYHQLVGLTPQCYRKNLAEDIQEQRSRIKN